MDVPLWRKRSGYSSFERNEATLLSITQMIQSLESENREYTRDRYKTRVEHLDLEIFDDAIYSDILFSSIPSIRGYRCFQVSSLKKYRLDKVTLIHSEANAPEAYEDIIKKYCCTK